MKKEKIFLSVLLLLFFSINFLVAQALELDISKAQKIALENNIQYKLAEEALSKAKAQVTEARGGMLPSLSAFSQYQRAWELPTVILMTHLVMVKLNLKWEQNIRWFMD